MVIVVFTIQLAADIPEAEYEQTAAEMAELVQKVPGFVGMDYAETDGREMLVARFESHEALALWRNEPEHKRAQQRGRERFFEHYRIEVCDEVRSYEFSVDSTA